MCLRLFVEESNVALMSSAKYTRDRHQLRGYRVQALLAPWVGAKFNRKWMDSLHALWNDLPESSRQLLTQRCIRFAPELKPFGSTPLEIGGNSGRHSKRSREIVEPESEGEKEEEETTVWDDMLHSMQTYVAKANEKDTDMVNKIRLLEAREVALNKREADVETARLGVEAMRRVVNDMNETSIQEKLELRGRVSRLEKQREVWVARFVDLQEKVQALPEPHRVSSITEEIEAVLMKMAAERQ